MTTQEKLDYLEGKFGSIEGRYPMEKGSALDLKKNERQVEQAKQSGWELIKITTAPTKAEKVGDEDTTQEEAGEATAVETVEIPLDAQIEADQVETVEVETIAHEETDSEKEVAMAEEAKEETPPAKPKRGRKKKVNG